MAKNVEDVLALLGGLDCGACGYATCEECAKAIVAGEVDGSACVMIDEEAQEKINSFYYRHKSLYQNFYIPYE